MSGISSPFFFKLTAAGRMDRASQPMITERELGQSQSYILAHESVIRSFKITKLKD